MKTKKAKKVSPATNGDKAKQNVAAELEASIKGNQLAGIDTVTALKEADAKPEPAKPVVPVVIPKPPAIVEEIIRDRYEFTDAEKLALGSGLAQGNSQIAALKEEAKSTAADYKAKVQAVSAGVNSATEKINSGFEMRAIECVVLHQRKVDKGQLPWKAYYRKDTGAFVRKEPMSPADFALLNIDYPAGRKLEDPYFPPKPDEKK